MPIGLAPHHPHCPLPCGVSPTLLAGLRDRRSSVSRPSPLPPRPTCDAGTLPLAVPLVGLGLPPRRALLLAASVLPPAWRTRRNAPIRTTAGPEGVRLPSP